MISTFGSKSPSYPKHATYSRMPTRCHESLEGLLYANLFRTCQNDWQVDNLSIVTADVLLQAQADYSPTNAIIELPSAAAQIWM